MNYKSSNTLQLHPWRDGVNVCIRALEAAPDTNNVALVCNPADDVNQNFFSSDLLASLLEFIGRELFNLTALSIQFHQASPTKNKNNNTTARWPSALATPPISAITTLLATSETIQSLSLIGLQLLGDDDLDMNGFQEAIRIHPSLSTLVIRKCSFAKNAHLEKLKTVTYQRTRNERWSWKHLDISGNIVLLRNSSSNDAQHSSTNPHQPLLFSWESPLLSWCLYPIACCV